MDIVHNRGSYSNKQVLKVQETPDSIPEGETPHTISVFAYDALIDIAKPGDRVEITGIYKAVPGKANSNRRMIKVFFLASFLFPASL
jgi:DNA replication licensing factor MCM4